MSISGIRWPPPRSGLKKRGSKCKRQNATLTLSSSSMSTPGGEQTAPNILTFCRGCLHLLRRQDGKNMNEPFVRAASDWSLGQKLRWKLQLSRWWDSEPPGRRSKGSTMKCISKRGYWAPHHMGQNGRRLLIRRSALPWKSGCGRDGVLPGQKGIWEEPLQVFCGLAATQIPSQDPGKEWGLTWPGPQWS